MECRANKSKNKNENKNKLGSESIYDFSFFLCRSIGHKSCFLFSFSLSPPFILTVKVNKT